MNQKIIIIGLSILCIIGIIFIFLLVFNKPAITPGTSQPAGQASSYILSINDYNDSLSGSIIVNGQITQLTGQTLPQYALTSFNSPHDILWAECPINTYTTSGPVSSTGNSIINDPIIGPGISINVGQQNNITITCTKK